MDQHNQSNPWGWITNFFGGGQATVYAALGLLSACIIGGATLIGLANVRAGRIFGGVWAATGQIFEDAYREAENIPDDQEVDAWEEVVGQRIPDWGVSIVTTGTVPSEVGPAIQPTPEFSVVPTEVPAEENTQAVEDAARQTWISEQLLAAQGQWYATGDWDTLLGTIEQVATRFQPGEQYGLYESLLSEGNQIKTASGNLVTGYEELKTGGANPADPIERLKLAIALKDSADIVLGFLNSHGLTQHPSYPAAQAGYESAEYAMSLLKAYSSATVFQDADQFYSALGTPFVGSTWSIVAYDNGLGTCNCATLRAATPVTITSVEIAVPSEMLNKYFSEATGPLTEEVGQTIVFQP